MPYVRYIATEKIVPEHVLNVEYTLRFSVQSADPKSQVLKREPRALAGNKETLYFGRIDTWSVVMEPVPTEIAKYVEEFLASTADGQSFEFDPYGTPENPSPWAMQCDREDGGHAPRRVTITGDPQYSDHLEYSFEVSVRS